ncbi:MAG: hypothetical protein M3Z22_02050 [Verrucomicrobiota bacterium]|nr:hypothetical protein [Verrucomicrobiota bacterium]
MYRNRIVRSFVVAVASLAWLAVSNHCAIAAVEGAAKVSMAGCHGMSGDKQMPAKHDRGSSVECCKVLRATLLTLSSNLAAHDTFTFALHDYVIGILPLVDGPQTSCVIEWDTGPPGLGSFAESVLQRSILAHAPPVLA